MNSQSFKLIFFPLILILQVLLLQVACSRDAHKNFPDLENYNGQTEDLLIIEGDGIVPEAIEKVKTKTTPKRTFIMLFLGNGMYQEAAPVMEQIVLDETDPNREVALAALFQIDNEIGTRYAHLYSVNEGKLGGIANDILQDKSYLHERKTYFQALRGYIAEMYF